MSTILIKNATIINENKREIGDVLINKNRIERIDQNININQRYNEIDAEGLYLIPGLIDDQVHFREPGSTDAEDLESGSGDAKYNSKRNNYTRVRKEI